MELNVQQLRFCRYFLKCFSIVIIISVCSFDENKLHAPTLLALFSSLLGYTKVEEHLKVNTNSGFNDISVLKCTLMVSVVMC